MKADNLAANLVKKAKALVSPLDNEKEALGEQEQNIAEYNRAVGGTISNGDSAPAKSPEDAAADKVNARAKYGDRPGEQRIDTSDMTKPLPSMRVYDEGGELPAIPDVSRLRAGREGAPESLDANPELIPSPSQPKKSLSFPGDEPDQLAERRKANARAIQGDDDNIDVTKLPTFDEGGDMRVRPIKGLDVNDGKHSMAILKEGERVLTPQQNAEYMKNQHGFKVSMPRMSPFGSIAIPQGMDVNPKADVAQDHAMPRMGVKGVGEIKLPKVFDEGGDAMSQGTSLDQPDELISAPSTDGLTQPKELKTLPDMKIPNASDTITPPGMDVIDLKRNQINDHMIKAADTDDIIGLGKGAIAHAQVDKAEQRGISGLSLPGELKQNTGLPRVTSPTAAADSMSLAAQETSTPAAQGMPKVNPSTPEGYKQQEAALKAKIIDPDTSPIEAAQAEQKLAQLRQYRPMSSRSGLDKFGHILGEIAEPALLSVAPQADMLIPGSKLNLGMERKSAEHNLKAVEEDALAAAETKAKGNPPTKQEDLARLEMGKLSTMLQDSTLPDDQRKLAENRQQVLQAEYPTVLGAPTESKAPKVNFSGDGAPMSITQGKNDYLPGAKNNPPEVQALFDQANANYAKKLTDKDKPSSQEEADQLNALYDPDLKRAGLPTGQFRKDMTKDERSTTRQAVTSTIAQLRMADVAANAAEVAKNKQADAKSQYSTVQMGINKLADPEIIKMYDKPGVAAALANATAETVTHMGAYVPGVGGFTIPTSTLDNMVTRGVISATDASKLVDAYNTGVESAMDFMLIQQGGKIGRGGKALLEPLFNLLPGPKTVGSKDAMQKLNNFQDVFDIWKKNHPALSEGVTSYRDKGYTPASQPTDQSQSKGNLPPGW